MRAGYTIRQAERADLDGLVALHLELQDYLEATNPELWQMTADGRGRVRSQLSARLGRPGCRAVVAEHDRDGVVGMAWGRTAVNCQYVPERTGSVDQIYVRAEHRRVGVGTSLVGELCLWFAEEGVNDLSLRYVEGNEAAAGLWEALGFSRRIVIAGAVRREVEARLATRR